jgi:Cu-processing system ATP-binding protein
VIRYESFSKSYGAYRAVRDLTLEVARGEVVALLGPNGSGKTTTLKAAAGLLTPSSGAVTIDGRPAGDPSARRLLSFLPQKVAFPDTLTGREVVEFYARLRGLDASRVAAAVELALLEDAVRRPVGSYSGGMVQRLGLAVASLPRGGALLLDEPTAALDPHGLSSFYTLVDERRRAGETVLFTSHQLGDVERLADRAAVLVEGRLAGVLGPDEIARAARVDDLYRHLVRAA